MKRLSVFNGELKPGWNPELNIKVDVQSKVKKYLKPEGLSPKFIEYFYLVDNFLDKKSCEGLISEFSLQASSPVGVSGYSDVNGGDQKKNTEVGSFRSNAWSVILAEQISVGLKSLLVDEWRLKSDSRTTESVFLNENGEQTRMPLDPHIYSLLGSTPFMRFMKYPSGGRHVPHYDAPYINSSQRYVTLMSWVIYLNSPVGIGGEFQFVDDNQWHLSPAIKNKADWQRMAEEKEIIESVKPTEGRLLVFPHWLAHQVSLYTGTEKSWRYIIRGDVAYGY